MFTSGIFRHISSLRSWKACTSNCLLIDRRNSTYTKDCRVVGNLRWLVFFDSRSLLNSQIFNITATKDNVFVDLIRWWDFIFRTAFSSFCAEGRYILEGDGRCFRVDLVKRTDVAKACCSVDLLGQVQT